MATAQHVAKTRGLLIDVLLVLGGIGLLTKLWSVFVLEAGLSSRLLISPSRDPIIDIISCLLLAAALYGIWRLKKWGAYLVLLRLAYTIVVQVLVYQSLSWQLIGSYNGISNLLGDVLGAVLWVWAFSRKWSFFT
jgi:hypothetical protein